MGKENQSFKQVIQSYLEQRAKRDSLFATSFAKQNKNIDECCNYRTVVPPCRALFHVSPRFSMTPDSRDRA